MENTAALVRDTELFAKKGKAAPLTARAADALAGEEDASAQADRPPPPDKNLFGEAVEETAEVDADTLDEEPAPAASLLSILSQRSAATLNSGRATDTAVDIDRDAGSAEIGIRLPEPPPTDTGETAPAVDISEMMAAADVGGTAAAPAPEETADIVPVAALPVPVEAETAAEPRRTSRGYWLGGAVAACLVTAVGAYLVLEGLPSAPGDARAGGEVALPAEPTAGAETPAAADPVSATPAEPVSPAPPADADDTEPATTETAAAPQEMPAPAPASAPVAGSPRIEIGLVRIEDGGAAVIAGHATPGADLIVLHNDLPLGKTRADGNGDWLFTTDMPAGAERHEISVVPMQVDSSVVVTRPEAAFVPRPGRRPDPPPAYPYIVQLASLPSAAEARIEAEKIAPRLKSLFAADRYSIRSARIDSGRQVYRVAIEGFASQKAATETCARVRALDETCLVLRVD